MHGGDIYRNKIEYDFSVNINPCGTPDALLDVIKTNIDNIEHYPDIKCEKLRVKLATYYNKKFDADMFLCGNGASELLLAIAHALMPSKAVVVAPGFSGYTYALAAVGCEVTSWKSSSEKNFQYDEGLYDCIRANGPNIIMLSNPSNPVGNVMSMEFVRGLIDVAEGIKAYLVIDECFMELSANESRNSLLRNGWEYDRLIVLNAFTKTYAIPGIRLGYLVSKNKELNKLISKHLPEWNVSIPAMYAGSSALGEKDYIEKSRLIIEKERKYLVTELEKLGMKVFPSVSCYILFRDDNKRDIYNRLLQNGILIRDCSNYEGLTKGYYRIAVKRHRENEYLINILRKCLSE